MKVFRFEKVGSTQDVAREILERESPPFAVIASVQLSGRGREGRSWLSPLGGFWATIALEKVSKLQFRASLAIIDSCEFFGVKTYVKWPNDVVVGKRKLAGVLVESEGKVKLLGVGVNVNNDPPIPFAISLKEILGRKVRMEEFEEEFFECFKERIVEPEEKLMRDLKRNCETIGKRVEVVLPTKRVVGTAIDVGDEGELILYGNGKEERVFLGDVYRLRELRKVNNRSFRVDIL